MTSNIGSQYLLDGINEDGSISDEAANSVEEELRAHFRPEFLNRLDEIIMFKPLTKDNIGHIIDLILADTNRRIAERGLKIELTDQAKEYIAEQAYDPIYGARPLKRYMQKNVETLSARRILEGDAEEGSIISITVGDTGLIAQIR
jgi:ATP-dependent Clp protease ATP-binding subunit ClpB